MSLNTTTKRKRLSILLRICVIAILLVIIANMTWTYNRQGQIEVDTTPCTSTDYRVCQQTALLHLSDVIRSYPQSRQYTVRWYGSWTQQLILHDDGFKITFNPQQHDLMERSVGKNEATMAYCDHVTDKAILSVAASSGDFEAFSKYGGNYKPL